MVQYVYGQNCMVTPDSNGHVSAADLSAALDGSSVIGTASRYEAVYSTSGFYYCTLLKSIEIPASVTTIKKRAFYRTHYLKNITFLGNIATIEGRTVGNMISSTSSGAFYSSGLGANDMSITFMGTVGTIGDYAFASSGYNANDMSLTFVGDVGTIGDYAFRYSGVTSVTYGGNPPNLGTLVFASSQYENCRLDGNSPGMNLETGRGTYGGSSDSFMDCRHLTSVTIENGVTNLGFGVCKYPIASRRFQSSYLPINDCAICV